MEDCREPLDLDADDYAVPEDEIFFFISIYWAMLELTGREF